MRDSSRSSQFFANFQSLITVSGEIFNTSAVSSTLNPPKNRSSTTWAFRSYLRRQGPKRVVDGNQVVWCVGGDSQVLVERHTMERAAALLVVAGAREVDEHAAHEAGGHREEVRAILPLHPSDINEPDVNLVDERGCLEDVIRTLPGHVPPGQSAQFTVHERDQLLHGPVVAGSPFDE